MASNLQILINTNTNYNSIEFRNSYINLIKDVLSRYCNIVGCNLKQVINNISVSLCGECIETLQELQNYTTRYIKLKYARRIINILFDYVNWKLEDLSAIQVDSAETEQELFSSVYEGSFNPIEDELNKCVRNHCSAGSEDAIFIATDNNSPVIDNPVNNNNCSVDVFDKPSDSDETAVKTFNDYFHNYFTEEHEFVDVFDSEQFELNNHVWNPAISETKYMDDIWHELSNKRPAADANPQTDENHTSLNKRRKIDKD